MATFDYSLAGWTKEKPMLMKSGDLGDALKAYEKLKKPYLGTNTAKAAIGDVLADYKKVLKAQTEVDEARVTVIEGLNAKKEKDLIAYLESADPDAEIEKLTGVVIETIETLIKEWEWVTTPATARNQKHVKELKLIIEGLIKINTAIGVKPELQATKDKLGEKIDKIDIARQDENDSTPGRQELPKIKKQLAEAVPKASLVDKVVKSLEQYDKDSKELAELIDERKTLMKQAEWLRKFNDTMVPKNL